MKLFINYSQTYQLVLNTTQSLRSSNMEIESNSVDSLIDIKVDSMEDTEDASETDQVKTDEVTVADAQSPIHEKIQNLRDLLRQLQNGSLPGYLSRLAKIESQYEERMHRCEVDKELDLKMVNCSLLINQI